MKNQVVFRKNEDRGEGGHKKNGRKKNGRKKDSCKDNRSKKAGLRENGRKKKSQSKKNSFKKKHSQNKSHNSETEGVSMVYPGEDRVRSVEDTANHKSSSKEDDNGKNKSVGGSGTIRAPESGQDDPFKKTKEPLKEKNVDPPPIITSTRRCPAMMFIKIFGFSMLYVIFFLAIWYLLSFVEGTQGITVGFGLIILILDLITVALIYNSWRHTEYQIREHSIVNVRQFLFSRKEKFYSLKPDFDFKVKQGFLGRLFNCGSIVLTGPLSVEEPVVLREFPDPYKYLKKLMEMVNNMMESQF